MKMNELTEIDQLLAHVDSIYWDDFCDVWYRDLNEYKECPHTLLMMANAVLVHWGIALYAEDVTWSDRDECFIWHFKQQGNL
jgi:hypothetical protein